MSKNVQSTKQLKVEKKKTGRDASNEKMKPTHSKKQQSTWDFPLDNPSDLLNITSLPSTELSAFKSNHLSILRKHKRKGFGKAGILFRESNANLDETVSLRKELQILSQRTNIRSLWGTAQLFLHPWYMHDASTSEVILGLLTKTYPPTTAEEKLARKNELKARGTLLMALLNEHHLKFNTYKCAKSLMKAIEKKAEEGPTNFALKAYTSSGSSSSLSSDSEILKLDIMFRDNALIELRKKFEKAKKERDDLKLKLEKFENSSKNLSKLLEIQVSEKFKTGVGESITSVPTVATSEVKTIKSKPKSVSEPLIEDCISDSEDENETGFKSKQRKPSFAKVEFVKSNEHVKTPRESVKKVESNKQAKYPRKNSQSPRGNKRNWNNMMT
ncbi:hypothetical protein Tco_0378068 [Tanacetum coccineum]